MDKLKQKETVAFIGVLIIALSIIIFFVYKQYQHQKVITPLYSLESHEYERLTLGIDVSEHQQSIDWKKVADSSIEFAIIRSSYGWSDYVNQTDAYFEQNYHHAKENGIKVGIYHYSYATTIDEATKEAEFVLHLLKNKKMDYPIFYDMEDECMSDLDQETLTAIASTFCERLKKEGYYVGLYTNPNFLSRMNLEQIKQYDLWLANYNVMPTDDFEYGLWQYSCYGKVYGIDGDVDLNFSYYDYEKYIKDCHLN